MTKKRLLIVVAVLFLFLFVAWRWIARTPSEADDQSQAAKSEGAIPAAFVRVGRGSLEDTLTISGAFKPFQDVDVHAKVAGYIRKIFVDVGDHVREGQTLAELEIPELAAQLSGADAAARAAQQQIRRAEGEL